MLNYFPDVRKQLLSVAASLLACIIFYRPSRCAGLENLHQQWNTWVKNCSALCKTNTYSSTTARELHTVPF
jgi:hypothetical protein